MLCFKYHPKTLLFCELLALTRWSHIFLYFSLTECQKSCSHPMTPHFLSLCSHRMPQPVGGRALHPYPLHIWLPLPPPPRFIVLGLICWFMSQKDVVRINDYSLNHLVYVLFDAHILYIRINIVILSWCVHERVKSHRNDLAHNAMALITLLVEKMIFDLNFVLITQFSSS